MNVATLVLYCWKMKIHIGPSVIFFFFLNVTELLYLEVWLNWSFTYKHLLKYFFSSIL